MDDKITVEVVSGPEGPSLNIMGEHGGTRVAGPKAWGGGRTLYSFKVYREDLLRAIADVPTPEGVK